MHHERTPLITTSTAPLLWALGPRWSIIFIVRTISLVLICVYLLTLVVFISYFTIDAHDTHRLHKLHLILMHLLQTTIWTAAVYDHFLQHTSAASPSTYIILSICERYFRSLTLLLRNRSASTKRKISFRHRYELCHYVHLAYWPSSSCSIYTNIYPFGCGWRSHGYPMQ